MAGTQRRTQNFEGRRDFGHGGSIKEFMLDTATATAWEHDQRGDAELAEIEARAREIAAEKLGPIASARDRAILERDQLLRERDQARVERDRLFVELEAMQRAGLSSDLMAELERYRLFYVKRRRKPSEKIKPEGWKYRQSDAGRKNIGAAQRLRWQKWRAEQGLSTDWRATIRRA